MIRTIVGFCLASSLLGGGLGYGQTADHLKLGYGDEPGFSFSADLTCNPTGGERPGQAGGEHSGQAGGAHSDPVGSGHPDPAAGEYPDPAAGEYPDPAAVCAVLERTGADPAKIRPAALLCMALYRPVTAWITGTWHGRPLRWSHTYGNVCEMKRATGVLFKF